MINLVPKNQQNLAGIYGIFNIINGKVYIGQTNKFSGRCIKHRSDLKRNRHKNQYLAAEYKKYPKDKFEFCVIEIVSDLKLLTERENYWLIEAFAFGKNCYNFAMAQDHISRIIDPDEYKRLTALWVLRGKNRTKEYKLISPEGKLFEGKGIRKFCLEQNLNEKQINALLHGTLKSSKGWTIPNGIPRIQKISKYIGKILISPDDKEVILDVSPMKFCIKYNLNYQNFMAMLKGDIKSSKEWRFPGVIPKRKKKEKISKRKKEFSLISPDGVIYSGTNISKFAKEHNLSFKSLSSLLLGNIKSHKEWRKPEDKEYSRYKTYDIKLISPTGEIFGPIKGIRKFAKDYGLYIYAIKLLANGGLKSHKGWKLFGNKEIKRKMKKYKSITILSPNGKEYSGTVSELSKICGLKESSLRNLPSKRRISLLGWKLIKVELNENYKI